MMLVNYSVGGLFIFTVITVTVLFFRLARVFSFVARSATPRYVLPDDNAHLIFSCLTTPVLKRGRCSPVTDVLKTHPPPYVESVSEYSVYVFFCLYIYVYILILIPVQGWKAQFLDWCFPFLGEWLCHWRYLINNKIIPLGFAKSFISLYFKFPVTYTIFKSLL